MGCQQQSFQIFVLEKKKERKKKEVFSKSGEVEVRSVVYAEAS